MLGNWVNRQFQLDAFGEALLLLAAAAGHGPAGRRRVAGGRDAVDAIEQRWREPDAGIWELEPDNWTHSRLICVAGLRASPPQRPNEAAGLACPGRRDPRRDGRHGRAPEWALAAFTDRPACRCGAAAAGDPGGLAADDPRSLATLQAVEAELSDDGYCYRFRPDARPLGEAEGAFLLCGFLPSLAWASRVTGPRRRWFERSRAACGPAGLLWRSTTSFSGRCEATSRRPSSTRRCCSARSRCPPTDGGDPVASAQAGNRRCSQSDRVASRSRQRGYLPEAPAAPGEPADNPTLAGEPHVPVNRAFMLERLKQWGVTAHLRLSRRRDQRHCSAPFTSSRTTSTSSRPGMRRSRPSPPARTPS